MNTRLQQFIAAENITQAQFADSIGVARASVSHIIAGRNRPGFEFISNMARRYPALNLEWLITGSGKMYKESARAIIDDDLLFPDEISEAAAEVPTEAPAENHVISQSVEPQAETPQIPEIQNQLPEEPVPVKEDRPARKAAKVIIFYDDGTFQEL